jgi:hypothetical protein
MQAAKFQAVGKLMSKPLRGSQAIVCKGPL